VRGHIHKRERQGKNGKTVRWYVVVDVGSDDKGRRKQKWHGGYRTRREAERALAEIVGSLEKHTYVAPTQVTVASFAREEWLPTMRTQVTFSTWDSYRRNLERHVLPVLGGKQLQQITAGHLNTLYRSLLTGGGRNGSRPRHRARPRVRRGRPRQRHRVPVYHSWDPGLSGRRTCAARLSWADGESSSPGPRTDPQPYPAAPVFRDLFEGRDGAGLDPARWRTRGRWETRSGGAVHPEPATVGHALATVSPRSSYLLEVNLALRQPPSAGARYGAVASHLDDGNHSAVLLDPAEGRVTWRCGRGGIVRETSIGRLAAGFSPAAYHQLLVRRAPGALHVTLDGVVLQPVADPLPPGDVGLWANASTAFTGVALTDLQGPPGADGGTRTGRTGAVSGSARS
jgi:hypothetical protein